MVNRSKEAVSCSHGMISTDKLARRCFHLVVGPVIATITRPRTAGKLFSDPFTRFVQEVIRCSG